VAAVEEEEAAVGIESAAEGVVGVAGVKMSQNTIKKKKTT
jgi:hypothetical protein